VLRFKPSHKFATSALVRDEGRDGALTQAEGKPVMKVGLFIIEAVIDPALCPSKDLMRVTNIRALVTL
jgi:hypothetical protein